MRYEKTAGYFLHRALQTVLSVCMWIVSAASISQAEELQPPREILRYSEPEAASEQLEDPPAVFMRETVPYYLASWEISEEELPGRMQYGESCVVYEAIGMNAEIPETGEISVEGEDGLFSVPLVRRQYMNERWEDDFEFTLTFHSCQADVYELGELEILSDPDSEEPALQGCEEELLKMLGLSGEYYRITGYEWAGEAYRDEGGMMCRDASAAGERMVRDCQAVYGGEVVLPPKKVYRTKAVYCLQEGKGKKKPVPEENQEKGGNRQDESAEPVWREEARLIIKRLISVTVRLGLLFLLLLLFRLAVRAGQAVWKRWGNRKE